jgi:hypothetical protein
MQRRCLNLPRGIWLQNIAMGLRKEHAHRRKYEQTQHFGIDSETGKSGHSISDTTHWPTEAVSTERLIAEYTGNR